MKEPFCGAQNYLNGFIISEIVIAIVIVVVTTIYYCILASYLIPKDRRILFGQLLNFYTIGFQIIVLFVASLMMWRRLWCLPGMRDLQMFVQLWLIFCLVIIVNAFGTTWSVSICIDALEAEAETAMLNGVDAYYTCRELKLLWDELQYNKQCCGVNNYMDWMDTYWMEDIAKSQCKANALTTYAPYSCCRQDCKNYSPNGQNIAELNLTQINTDGCLSLYTENIWKLVYIVFGLLMVVLKLQVFIWALVRFILQHQCEDDKHPTLNTKSSTSCIDPDLEAPCVIEVCSCGKILKCDAAEDICRNSASSSDKICNCNQSEIIH